jgi:hypothetical protein
MECKHMIAETCNPRHIPMARNAIRSQKLR